MNSFISWVGGKMALRDEIISRFPLGYNRYIEVFGGAGWVLFRKQPEKFEVYNDFNSNLANLFRVVKADPEALIRQLDWTLNSRDDFELLKALFAGKAEMGDVERAANFFRLIKLSYGSKCESFGGNPVVLERSYPAIRGAHRRLARGVVIENRDFEALIRQHDRVDAFFYLDPPYFGTEDYYQDVGFTQDDHLRILNSLRGIEGKFLLSYNDDPFIRNLRAKASMFLWTLNNIAVICVGALISAFAIAQLGFVLPIVATAVYAFLTIRFDDVTILDFIRYAFAFFVGKQQIYHWRETR